MGYFPPGKVPAFERKFFDMPTGTESEAALNELKEDIYASESLSDIDKINVWKTFRDRITSEKNQLGRIIDMGMDIEI